MKLSTTRWSLLMIGACTILFLSACATSPTFLPRVEQAPSRAADIERGIVRSIEVIDAPASPISGGAVLGGVVGGLVGNQIGSGGGRAAATIAGAVGGALLGNHVEQRQQQKNPERIYRVLVQFESGATQIFNFRELGGLSVGDRVRYGNGVLGRG